MVVTDAFWSRVCYEGRSKMTQPEVRLYKVGQSFGLVVVTFARREERSGKPSVLLGVFCHCSFTELPPLKLGT